MPIARSASKRNPPPVPVSTVLGLTVKLIGRHELPLVEQTVTVPDPVIDPLSMSVLPEILASAGEDIGDWR
jgi:hypothetical protein